MLARNEDGTVSLGRLDYVIQTLIILSLFAFCLETVPDLSKVWRERLLLFERFTVIVFSIEYIARLWFSRPKFKYAISFFGIVDLLAILPFYIAIGVDLRSLRAFRLLRLFRLLKLARYSEAMQRYHRAFIIAREELVLFGATALIMLFLASVGIYYFEQSAQPETFPSIFHCMWWSVTTLTTVGYGDTFPITAGGKIFTFFVLVMGLGIVAIPTGLFATALSKAREEEDK